MKDDDLVICRCEDVTEAELRETIGLGVTRMIEVKR
ncbi:hypothetical protein LCGC14_3005520, partial [marine sediment metagenome]